VIKNEGFSEVNIVCGKSKAFGQINTEKCEKLTLEYGMFKPETYSKDVQSLIKDLPPTCEVDLTLVFPK
jgi:hypothetical protein